MLNYNIFKIKFKFLFIYMFFLAAQCKLFFFIAKIIKK